jgi:diguanylate cyclase (GGDEF)-like protein
MRSRMERLLERWRPYDERRLTRREVLVEAAAAAGLVAVAAVMVVVLPTDRAFDPLLAAALTVCFALASRVRMHVGAGFAMPTQLVLVPMLFLLPPATVPACVAVALGGSGLFDAARGRAHPERVLTGTADAWHAVAPSLVFVVAGSPPPEHEYWAVVVVAVLAQFATDLTAATAREWLGRGIAPAAQTQVIVTVYLIDACLTPVGVLIAMACAFEPYAFVLAVPLLALLTALAEDRRRRIRDAVDRLDELTEEHVRLDGAIHRIGEAFGSKLDRAALVDIGLRTAVEAVRAQFGRAVLATGTIEQAEPAAGAGDVMAAAGEAAQRAGALCVAEKDGVVAMAQTLTGNRRASTEALVVARCGEPFTPDEQALFAYLTQQTALAIENVALHDRLRRQASVDDLTGLSNHRRFHEVLALEVDRMSRTRSPMALALVGIDDFKAVNDAQGRVHGDAMLQAVADAVSRACRGDDEPARFGGDVIAVILPETDLAGARRFGEGVRRSILPLGVSVSVGVSAMEAGGADAGALIAAADAALRDAKHSGKNRTCAGDWARSDPGRFSRAPHHLRSV